MNELTQKKDFINYLKGIAAFFVVLGHCLYYLGDYGTTDIVGGWIGVLISSTHVPLFFLVAGYLSHPQKKSKYYIKKIKRILVPFIVFSCIKIAFSVFVLKDFSHGSNAIEILYDTFFLGGSYWFVYCILIIFLITPLLWKKENEDNLRYTRKLIIIIAILVVFNIINVDFFGGKLFIQEITIGGTKFETPFYQVEMVFNYLPYFLGGMIIKANKEFISKNILRRSALLPVAGVLAIAVTTFVTMGFINKGFFFKMVIAFSNMLILYRVCRLIPSGNKVLNSAGKYSLHIMFFDSFYRVALFVVFSKIIACNTLIAIVIAILTVALACISCKIIEKIPIVRNAFGL